MTDDIMARPDGTGSRASTEPASGLGPSGFDPSREGSRSGGDYSGYVDAFYDVAKLLGIGARAKSPADVWRDEMLPALQRALATTPSGGEGAIRAVTAEMRRFMPNACGDWADKIEAALATTPSPDASPDSGGTAGTFACPICGDDTPHHHTAPVVDAYQTKGARS